MSATLAELLDHEIDRVDEVRDDIIAIKISNGVGYDADGCREVTFTELQEFEGDAGFGLQRLPNIYAYSEDRVYFKRHYDGSEAVVSVPRNPTDEPPQSFGGG